MDIAEARSRFTELTQKTDGVLPADLDAVWSALEPVRAEDVLGAWKGSQFLTGHRLCRKLTASNWHGKNFESLERAQPLICRNDNGELYSDVETGGGEASLWNIEFRGEVTATMVYDGAPIFDHFKRVDSNTLMGIMNGKPALVLDGGHHYYFALERE
ncbi:MULTISPECIES: DUF4334 domain-containing protein [Nocardiaceae]|uniref:DUF4334 domain-containing protein n=1 Tax=Nocardiaceae TaxID=85025 RepID=UPI00055D9D70|nr:MULTISPECIES: DUF4334 domain-containing protein [Rhodococcus]OZF06291.1 hypothetical protein CH301_01835 [Rhodococcus sp. 15-1189-1-1a]OZF21059.1 hypothetical protein CH299_02220 [Rhodococcus sp. 14-2686-1-2]OZF57559.1 hypothetical protein CH293_02205 [Rhodococcus sp. 14-2470-1b]